MKFLAESSIFTAELCGLQLANQVRRDCFVIISHSRSALQVVEHYNSTHLLIHKVVHWLHRLHLRGKTCCFCWCSPHVGVLGNENADRRASAAALDVSNAEVQFRDWYPIIQFRVKHKWNDECLAVGTNKLRSLKSSIDVRPSSCDRDRKISSILTRLRIGHTRLTHQHLMENRPPPYCTDC